MPNKIRHKDGKSDLILHYAAALAVILILGITLTVIPGQANPNLLVNPGFENNGTGWNNVGFGGRSITTTQFHSGSRSLQIAVSAAYTRNVYQNVTVTGGSTYDASGWIKTSGVGGSGAAVRLVWLNQTPAGSAVAGITIRTDTVGTVTGTQNWLQVSGAFAAPANAVAARFELYTSTDPDGSGTAWFDDTSLSASVPDTTPPIITNAQATAGQTTATVTWTTDEPGNSFVDYGTTTALGTTASGTNLVTSHSVQLSGLSASTQYFYQVTSCDTSNNCAASQIYSFTTPAPDTTPPSVSITSPSDGQTISGTVTVSVSASDAVAVAYVELYKNGLLFATDTASPYQYSWNTFSDSDGPHTLLARAADTSGNSANSQAVNVSVNNSLQPSRLNIVLILTDDQRWDDVQYMPLTMQLLGNQGVTFTNGFVTTPLCCPSRSSILTGLYTHNHGVLGNTLPEGGAAKFNDTSTVAVWLQSSGYRTGIYGKYLNRYINLTPWPYVPPGWDEWHVFKKNPDYYNYYLVENGVEVFYNSKAANYSTKVMGNKAVEFIKTNPQGQPFFLYFAPYAPHDPATPGNQDNTLFSNLTPWRPPSYNETDVSDKPTWVRKLSPISGSTAKSMDKLRLNRIRSLQAVDRAVAGIVDALNRTNQLNNTVIIFMSDNGYSLGEHRYFAKNCVYDECIRTPLLVRAPGIAPRVDGHIIANIDLAPTFAEWAGIAPPTKVNGMSFADLLVNPSAPWRSEILVEVLGSVPSNEMKFHAVRTDQYVYAEYLNGDREFYDLAADPYQLVNSVNNTAYTSIVSQLQSRLAVLKAE